MQRKLLRTRIIPSLQALACQVGIASSVMMMSRIKQLRIEGGSTIDIAVVGALASITARALVVA